MHRLIILACLLTVSIVALAGCDPDETDDPGSGTPAATSGATQPASTEAASGSPSPTALVSLQTPEPIDAPFGREPINEVGNATTPETVTRMEVADSGEYDRVTFVFDGSLPSYRVQYVTAPTECGSGQPVQINGAAQLEIVLSSAVAHDEAGNSTVASTDISAALPVLLEAKQTCDFEGIVTWVLGLSAEVDYRVFSLIDSFLVVDVLHP